MKAEEIAVMAGPELFDLVSRLQAAATSGRAVLVLAGVALGWATYTQGQVTPNESVGDKTGR